MAFAAVIWSAVGGAGLAWLGWAGFRPGSLRHTGDDGFAFFPGAEPVLNNYIPVLKRMTSSLPPCGSAVQVFSGSTARY